MSKLNAFAELIAEGKRKQQLEEAARNEKKKQEIAPLLADMFKTVEKAKVEADKNTVVKEEVLKLVKELESSVEKPTRTASPASKEEVNTNPTEGEEKRFEKLLKQLQNDFATLKRHVETIPRTSGFTSGSGEVRIARMDDISKVAPKDGDTLVWNSAKGIFEYAPMSGATTTTDEEMPFAKRVDFVGDTLIYKGEAPVGSLEADPVWRVHRLVISTDGDVTETWANGDSSYSHVWGDRLSYAYA